MNPAEKTAWVMEQALALGIDLCGVTPADNFPELVRGEEWLARGYAGEMRYLHDARRRSPAAAMDGARSIVVCALNYNTTRPYSTEEAGAPHPSASLGTGAAPPQEDTGPRGWISRYAWGDDYHDVLGEKLEKVLAAMQRQFGGKFAARVYVDTGPVAERVAAKYAGLGWLAKKHVPHQRAARLVAISRGDLDDDGTGAFGWAGRRSAGGPVRKLSAVH